MCAIDHPSQRASFEHYRTMITAKQADSEGLFKKDGWRQASDSVRKRYLLHLAEKITKFRREFNDGDQAFVLPVVQGTSENAAFRIIKMGLELWLLLMMDIMVVECTSPHPSNMRPITPNPVFMARCSRLPWELLSSD